VREVAKIIGENEFFSRMENETRDMLIGSARVHANVPQIQIISSIFSCAETIILHNTKGRGRNGDVRNAVESDVQNGTREEVVCGLKPAFRTVLPTESLLPCAKWVEVVLAALASANVCTRNSQQRRASP